MGNDYSVYLNQIKQLPSNICAIYAVPGAFYGINLSKEIIQSIQDVYHEIWLKDVEIKPHCDSIVKFKPHKMIMFNSDDAKNSAKSKQMFCRFHKLLCRFGWSLVSSPTLTYQYSLSSWFYFKQINPFLVNSGTIENEFCVIGLSSYDKFQFIDFPRPLKDPVIECIRQNWVKGIQKIETLENTENSWSLQMKGTPWSCHGEQSLDARYLVLCLIRFMSHHNWRLVNSTAMKPDASDTLFFRYFANSFDMPCPDTMPEYYFMLALMGRNYFSILGGDIVIRNLIANSCCQHEKKGIQPTQTKHDYPSVVLNSNIWSRYHEKEMETRKLITLLFQDLGTIGWLPIESIDCTRSIRDLSSIAFVRIPPVRMLYFCLCPRKYESICLINAVDEVRNIVLQTFIQYYAINSRSVKTSVYGIAYSIDFPGDPFRGGNTNGVVMFQIALAAIISALKEAEWFLVVSADTSDEVLHRDKDTDLKWSIYGLWFAKLLTD